MLRRTAAPLAALASLGLFFFSTGDARAQLAPAPYGPSPYGPQPTYGGPPPAYGPAYGGRPRAWREGDPVPPGYHVETGPRTGLVIAGGVVTGAFWVIGLPSAMNATNSYDRWLFAPVVGPWFDLASRPHCNSDWNCVGEVFIRMALVFDGLAQVAGAAMFTVGMTSEKSTLVPDSSGRRKAPASTFSLSVLPAPVSAQGFGLGAVGTF